MSLSDDLRTDVRSILGTTFNERKGRVIPDASDVKLGNDAVDLDATVLYADMSGSTALVDGFKWWFAAQIYKSFLHSACKIIRSEGGGIVSFDGDRVMAIFLGEYKNTKAAKTALKIHWVRRMINEEITRRKYSTAYEVKHCVGIDTSSVRAIRTGIRGSNDLVWVGRAANHAAKMTELKEDSYFSWVTKEVYSKLNAEAKTANDGRNMWEQRHWDKLNRTIYRSNFFWTF